MSGVVTLYRCSECGRDIGRFVDEKGEPGLFKCPRTGAAAQAVPA